MPRRLCAGPPAAGIQPTSPTPHMDSTVLAALIGATATLIAVLLPMYREWRIKNTQAYKFAYVKVLHLRNRAADRPPIYRVFVPRLEREVDVYDEFHYFRLNVYHRPRPGFSSTDRSSGVVDLQVLHPWQEQLRFTDRSAQRVEQVVSQHIESKSSVYFTRTMYYNGLQNGQEDFGMKMECDTDEARLIVDFSSLPGHTRFLRALPEGFLCTPSGERRVGVVELYPGVFSVSADKLKSDHVLRMNVHIEWSLVEDPSGLQVA